MEHVATLPLRISTEPTGPDALDQLLLRAPEGDSHLADSINRALSDQPGPRLLGLLDGGRLFGLTGTDGASCEAIAAKRLLELGYPWALHLSPQQLESVRALPKTPRARPRRVAFLASATAMGLGAIPAFIGLLELISEGTMRGSGLYSLLSLSLVVVNALFAAGVLRQTKGTLISICAIGLTYFGGQLNTFTSAGSDMFWNWLGASWLVTLAAVQLARENPQR
ncbi:MAG: hypothetical protein QM723_28750 [Myxococcaceae bacterium]